MNQATAEVGVFEAMHTQRAIRRYRPDPVPDELITKLTETQAMVACSATGQHVPLMQRFLDGGGQTREVERDSGAMAAVVDQMLELG